MEHHLAGYFIYSLDAQVFAQLTTAPTIEQGLILASAILPDLRDGFDEEGDDQDAADRSKWPLDRDALAAAICRRLAAPDWYDDLTYGDAEIWDSVVYLLDDRPGKKIRVGFRCENDGFLYWDAAEFAAQHGASMMAEPAFGNSGFRCSGQARQRLDLCYTLYTPAQVRELLGQLESVAPFFETLPHDEDGDRDQFLRGLLDPVRRIVAAGRVMWVSTDT